MIPRLAALGFPEDCFAGRPLVAHACCRYSRLHHAWLILSDKYSVASGMAVPDSSHEDEDCLVLRVQIT